MNRREFLRPRNLLKPAAQLLAAVEELRGLDREATNDPARDAVVLRFGRRAMATTFEVLLPFGGADSYQHAETALDLIDLLETQLTVYREESEVSRMNREAATAPVVVEENLFDLLAYCQRLTEETGGAFDVAVGALIKAWGFHRRAGRTPPPSELAAVRDRIGMRRVRLDPEQRTVFYERPGIEINFGSIGKGYALDCAAHLLLREGRCRHALLHGGHSSVLALGNEPGSRRGWPIGILDPENPQVRLGVVNLCDRGLATSAATFQYFEHEGRRLPHLLDPRSGRPAEGMLQATVTAPSAAEADALATAFFILGVDAARDYCEAHPEIGAILLPARPRTHHVLGAAREEWQ